MHVFFLQVTRWGLWPNTRVQAIYKPYGQENRELELIQNMEWKSVSHPLSLRWSKKIEGYDLLRQQKIQARTLSMRPDSVTAATLNQACHCLLWTFPACDSSWAPSENEPLQCRLTGLMHSASHFPKYTIKSSRGFWTPSNLCTTISCSAA